MNFDWLLGKRYKYRVCLIANGRHPYLKGNELDFFEGKRKKYVFVEARSWNDAERVALQRGPGFPCWSYHVEAIDR